MPHRYWTPEEDQDILKNYRIMSNSQLAAKYGVKKNVICHRFRVLTDGKTRKKSFTHVMNEYIIANWDSKSITEIAEALGVSKGTLTMRAWYMRSKMGIDLKTKHSEKGGERLPSGTIRIAGAKRAIKGDDGVWRYLKVEVRKKRTLTSYKKRPKPEKPPRPVVIRQPKEKVIKVKPIKVITPKPQKLKPITVAAPKRLIKKEPTRLPTKQQDYSQGTWVRIDKKTLVFKRTA
jgi:hypothetical protein